MKFVILRTNLALLGCLHFVAGYFHNAHRKYKDVPFLSEFNRINRDTKDLTDLQTNNGNAEGLSYSKCKDPGDLMDSNMHQRGDGHFDDTLTSMPIAWFDYNGKPRMPSLLEYEIYLKSMHHKAKDELGFVKTMEPTSKNGFDASDCPLPMNNNHMGKPTKENDFDPNNCTPSPPRTAPIPLPRIPPIPGLPPIPPSTTQSTPSSTHPRPSPPPPPRPTMTTTTAATTNTSRKPLPNTKSAKKSKPHNLHELRKKLNDAQARVNLEETAIKKAQEAVYAEQKSLEEATNYVRTVSSALQMAQVEVASAARCAQTVNLLLSAHYQLFNTHRKDVSRLSAQVLNLKAAEDISVPKSKKPTKEPDLLDNPEIENEDSDNFQHATETALH